LIPLQNQKSRLKRCPNNRKSGAEVEFQLFQHDTKEKGQLRRLKRKSHEEWEKRESVKEEKRRKLFTRIVKTDNVIK
jgi:hypothetical protein